MATNKNELEELEVAGIGPRRARPGLFDLPEVSENERLERSVERLRSVRELQPDAWRDLHDPVARRYALDRAGRELEQVYGSPRPPVLPADHAPENHHGMYSDERWTMTVNERLLDSDDPAPALETYLHEYRHSYQRLDIERLNSPIQPDSVENAVGWEANLRSGRYKEAPEDGLALANPERYERLFREYEEQPVERDAREFAREITERLYREKGGSTG
jgi:hypothetical protein